MMQVYDIYNLIDSFAPFCSAFEWDNCGILVGSGNARVSRIVTALDVTKALAEYAVSVKAELIVTHHPVIFSPVKSIDFDSTLNLLLQNGISVISAHTNLDLASGGTNKALFDMLKLKEPQVFENSDNIGLIGSLDDEYTASRFAAYIKEKLSAFDVQYINSQRSIKKVAVVSGAGGDYIREAVAVADCLVTGEVKHHEFVLAEDLDFPLFAAGHYTTEKFAANIFADRIKQAFPDAELYIFNSTKLSVF